MPNSVIDALLPVVLLIFIGFMVSKKGWLKLSAIQDVSNLAFLILGPALFFRSMSQVRLSELHFKPVTIYFIAICVVFTAVLYIQGYNRRGTILALSATFSNVTMIGVPLVNFAWGQQGLIVLFSLMSVHSLIMFSLVTSLLEFSVLRENLQLGKEGRYNSKVKTLTITLVRAAKRSFFHPVPFPIICGMLFGLTGIKLPQSLDNTLILLGNAFSPIALILVGMTLAKGAFSMKWKMPVMMAVAKSIIHPAILIFIGMLTGLKGVEFKVMVVAAALPIGANVYLFAQRYHVSQQEIMAGVAMSTILGMITLPAVIYIVSLLS